MLNLPVCRLLCLCGAIIRLYGSTNGAQCSTVVSWILPAPGVLSFPSISHNFAKLFAVQKYPAVLQTGEALTIAIIINSSDQWLLIFIYSNSPLAIFRGCWVAGRRHIQFDVRFVVDCLTFPGVNISSCLQPKCSPQECTLEDLRNNEEIAIKQWIWVLGAVNYLLLSNISASLLSTFHHHLHYLNFHF